MPMTAGGVISLLIILFGGFFIFYKRKMLMDVFSLNMQSSTAAFQAQLEEAAAKIVRQMEERMNHLEFLLAESEEKSRKLEEKLQAAEKFLKLSEGKDVFAAADNSGVVHIQETEAASRLVLAENQFVAAEKYKNQSLTHEEGFENNDRRKLILTMAEQGYNVTEIARATGVGKGEIMLLLQLHRK